MSRRLPIYLLLDTSGSMMGEPIESVNVGIQSLVSALRNDPYALETAYLSVIEFNSSARVVFPLTEVVSIQVPTISAGGQTNFGAAFDMAANQIESEVGRSAGPEVKGDWKPLIFFMTDGQPTDSNWRQSLSKLQSKKLGMFVACGVDGADQNTLKEITENVVMLQGSDANSFKAFFKWVTQSVQRVSLSADAGQGEIKSIGNLPPPPPEVNLV